MTMPAKRPEMSTPAMLNLWEKFQLATRMWTESRLKAQGATLLNILAAEMATARMTDSE